MYNVYSLEMLLVLLDVFAKVLAFVHELCQLSGLLSISEWIIDPNHIIYVVWGQTKRSKI